MSHTHGPEEGRPTCRFPTKKACDEYWTQFQHGHLGVPCVKEVQMSATRKGQPNKIATCTITKSPPKGLSFEGLVRWQIDGGDGESNPVSPEDASGRD